MFSDYDFLRMALELAQKRRGFCAPNPSVGCVIVDANGSILGQGCHQGPGSNHAEIEALKQLASTTQDLTMYVTLEPCCHWGRTPPCTDAIIKAGISRIIYAYKDPNPIVAGKGIDQLKAAKLRCEHKPLPEIDAFYASYSFWQCHQKPYVKAKLAMSLDGKIAGQNGETIHLTGPELKIQTHQARKKSDAILTTAKTIRNDNPLLNVRLEQTEIAKPVYILDRYLTLSAQENVFKTAKSVSIFYRKNQANIQKRKAFQQQNVHLIPVSEEAHGLNINEIMSQIGAFGIHDLWVEAGGQLFSSLMKSGYLHEAWLYIAPTWIGEGTPAFQDLSSWDLTSKRIEWNQYGRDVLGKIRFSL